MSMLTIVSHTSVVFWGGNRPKPMQSMCEKALNNAQEYWVPTLAFWGKVIIIILHKKVTVRFFYLKVIDGYPGSVRKTFDEGYEKLDAGIPVGQ